jgi:hypothetical protein
MPRKPKTTEPAAQATEAPKGSKTAAIRAALNAHPEKLPKELAALLKAQGWEVTGQRISVVKSSMKADKKAKQATPTIASKASPDVPKDAVSLGSLKKAKELAVQLGGIDEAKAALAALAQLLD